MSTHKYRTDPKLLMERGRAIVLQLRNPRTTVEARYRHRVEAVLLVLAGVSVTCLSSVFAENGNTLRNWVNTADEFGFEALREKKNPGRVPCLTREEETQLLAELRSIPAPAKKGVWNGPALAEHLNATRGMILSVRQCQRLLKKLFHQRRNSAVHTAHRTRVTREGSDAGQTDAMQQNNGCIPRADGKA